jgi:hypothetical protein
MACAGSIAETRVAYQGTATTILWEVSTDGATWDPVVASSIYSFSNDQQGSFFYSHLFIQTSIGMNFYRYRCTLSNSSGSSGASAAGSLYIAQSAPSQPVFLNPPSNVCQDQTITFSVGSGLSVDSIYWGGSLVNINYPAGLEDTMVVVHFPSAGSASLNVLAQNGCGSTPLTNINITVNSPQLTPAGVAGGGSVCGNFYVYPGLATTYSDGTCNPIAAITPSGGNPIFGNIQSCVTVDASVQTFGGIPYVPRHYSLDPSITDPSTSTATVTLYYTQGDFDAYNAARGTNPALPTGSADAAGIANLHITQFHGTGTTPDTYVGGSGDIDPDDSKIVWNATASRWEVTFDITGFSGFFVSGSSIIPLPLTLASFAGKQTKAGNQFSWTTSMEENTAFFYLQREETAGADFRDVAGIPAAGNSHQLRQYSYVDATGGDALYRLKMVDIDGKFTYSKIVVLGAAVEGLAIRVLPNPAHQPLTLMVGSPVVAGAVLTVTDVSGKKLLEKRLMLQKGNNSLDPGILAELPQGMYLIGVATDKQQQTIKFVKD